MDGDCGFDPKCMLLVRAAMTIMSIVENELAAILSARTHSKTDSVLTMGP